MSISHIKIKKSETATINSYFLNLDTKCYLMQGQFELDKNRKKNWDFFFSQYLIKGNSTNADPNEQENRKLYE